MTYEVAHHGLIVIADGEDRPGIYWLRLFRRRGAYVAVVTEVPGNPSLSVTNAAEGIARHVRSLCAPPVESLTLFEIWPRGALVADSVLVHRVHELPGLTWTDSSRSEIETLIEGTMPDIPPHAALYGRVLSLGGGVVSELWRPHFEATPVLDLPFPHEPFKCRYKDRYKAMEELAADDESTEALGQRFLNTLTEDDIKACTYHAPDWRGIANESVRIIEGLGDQDSDKYIAAAHRWRRPTNDRKWLISLFSQPVAVSNGVYSDGQHRGCALRFSGAKRAAIATRYELTGEESADWTYEGGG